MLQIRIKVWCYRAAMRLFWAPSIRELAPRAFFLDAAFRVLAFNGIGGDYLEFGSHGGRTFSLAHQSITRYKYARHLWSFDSFEGLPKSRPGDEHPHWVQRSMATGLDEFHAICRASGVPRGQYSVIAGYYEQSLAGMDPAAQPVDVALAYIDCDLLSSTRDVLRFLSPRLKHGMILAFDDYFRWSSESVSGERQAFVEFSEGMSDWRFLPYKSFGWHGMSFVVERANLNATTATPANS